MKNRLTSFLILMFLVSSFFACELISDKPSDPPTLDESLCELMKLEEVFEAKDGSDGNAVGEFAKDFSYSCQDGSIHKLSDFRKKKVVLIKFWAKFCYSCRKSLPTFNDLHIKYKDKGLVVLAINTVDSEDDVRKLVADYNFPNLYSGNPYFFAGYEEIPLHAIIDKDGVLQFVEIGVLPTNEEIEKHLKDLDVNLD